MNQVFSFDEILPLYYLWDAENRIYFGYLLSSLLFGLGYYVYFHKGKNLKMFFMYFFNPKVLFHPSSRNDLYLFIVNFWVKFFLIAPLIFTEVKLIVYVQKSLSTALPKYQPIHLNPLYYSILFTFVFFVIADFSRFYLHYILHRVPFLWEIHKVHHSAKVMTPLTLYRAHPIEAVLSMARQIFVIGMVGGVSTFLFANQYQMITIFGVQILGFVFNLLGSNLRHSHVPFSFGQNLESVFISPLMHQIHHSVNKNKNSKNMGSCLAIWDILFNTYLRPDFKPIRFGLSKKQRKMNLLTYVLNPFAYFQKKYKS